MNHDNRGRLTVDLGGNWRLYTRAIPAGSKLIGVVYRDGNFDAGALILTQAGLYAQYNDGVLRSLPQSKIQGAISAARAAS